MIAGGYVRVLTTIAVVGAGVVGGVFFAFSTFVMPAIRRLPSAEGMASMQSINRAAPTPLFMLALFGTGALSVALIIVTLGKLDEPRMAWVLVGAVVYLVCIVLTVVYHVPHNNRLDGVDPTAPDAVRIWLDYARGWTAWNHVRTLASVGAATCFAIALW
jgi:uncharacterized membrane protein